MLSPVYLCTGISLGSNTRHIPTVCWSGLGMFEMVCSLLLLPRVASESISGLPCCLGCCAAGSGWKSPLSVWQPQSGETSQSPTAHRKGEGQHLNGNAEMMAVVPEMCLKNCFVRMRRETRRAGWQGLKPFLCTALLPNKHTELMNSCYLCRFARYAPLCFCCLLCGLQARPAQQIKQCNSSVQTHPELVTANRVVSDGHPR